MKYFICLAMVILLCPSFVLSQSKSSYPHGMYTYWNSGIYKSGRSMTHVTAMSSTTTTLDKWYGTYKLNAYYWSHTYGDWGEWLNYFNNTYASNKNAYHIFSTPLIDDLCDGHYLIISPATYYTTDMYNRVKTSTINFSATAMGFFNEFVDNLTERIVDNMEIFGSDIYNHCLIRPRGGNTSIYYADTNYYAAKFTLKTKIQVNSPVDNDYKVIIKISNDSTRPEYPYRDHLNDNVFADTITIHYNTTNIESNLNIYLKCKNRNSGETIYSAYLYSPKMEIYVANVPNGAMFHIQSIELYDSVGYGVVVDSMLTSNSSVYKQQKDNFFSYNPQGIISLGDETVIGNYAPMKKVKDAYNSSRTKRTFFTTSPEINSAINFSDAMKRFVKQDSIEIIGHDSYRYGISGAGPIEHHISSLIQNYETLNNILTLRNYPSVQKIYNVLQAHSQKGQLADPPKNYILSQAYLSLLTGFDGILYWWSGPELGGQRLYDSTGFVTMLNNNVMGTVSNYTNYIRALIGADMIQDKREAINIMTNFLDKSIYEGKYRYVGDLIKDAKVINYDIIDQSSNPNNITNWKQIAIGNDSLCQISTFAVLNFSDGEYNSTQKTTVGINSFKIPTIANTSYFLLTNLNWNGDSCRVRLKLNSTNSKNLLKITTITDSTQIPGRTYSKDGWLNVELKKDAALLIKVENVNIDSTYNFPKNNIRFGVVRKDSSISKWRIYLDTDFNGLDNYYFELPYNNNKIITLDYNQDGYTDFASFKTTYYNSNYWIDYKIYQQGPGCVIDTTSPILRSILIKDNSVTNVGPVSFGTCYFGYPLGYYTDESDGTIKVYVLPVSGDPVLFKTYNNPAPGYTHYMFINKYQQDTVLYMYTNNGFYIDKNKNGNLESSEYQYFNPSVGHPNYPSYPIVDDWSGNSTGDYGVYVNDSWVPGPAFRLNFSGTDGWSYFEYPIGDSADIPITWKLNPSSKADEKLSKFISEEQIPKEYSLKQNYPNPFNPTTNIEFAIPKAGYVTLKVYDMLGREVQTLLSEQKSAGNYNVHFNAAKFSSGMYFYELRVDNHRFIKKMMLIK